MGILNAWMGWHNVKCLKNTWEYYISCTKFCENLFFYFLNPSRNHELSPTCSSSTYWICWWWDCSLHSSFLTSQLKRDIVEFHELMRMEAGRANFHTYLQIRCIKKRGPFIFVMLEISSLQNEPDCWLSISISCWLFLFQIKNPFTFLKAKSCKQTT
jgi:hypothetical protein